MKDEWFRWEREAAIHLLFPTLEAFYQPLFKYSGVIAPTMVLIFKKGVVTWCIQEKAFFDYGRKFLNIYKDPKKEKMMAKDIEKALMFLKRLERQQEKTNFQNLPNKDLINQHRELYKAFLDYYTMGAIGTPLSFVAESDLRAKGLTEEELNILTTPSQISYVSRADDYLLKTKNIKEFINKYFWINNNYSATCVVSEEEIKKRLNSLLSKSSTFSSNAKVKVKVKLSRGYKRLVELLKHYAIYKDDRKKEILIYLHYVDRILKEIARRMNLDIDEVRASFPWEIGDILRAKLTKEKLEKRLQYSVIAWEKNKDKASVLNEKDGKKWEQKTLSKVNGKIKEIKGNAASPGRVRGKVKILFKAGESGQLKKGEVLVTFMTSPDFMPAIRKCSAIVTNLGGVTCHAAIISRELKLPCIVGTKFATQILKDGDLVEVDANKGVIKILKN